MVTPMNPIEKYQMETECNDSELAKKTGFSQPTVTRHRNGTRKLSDIAIERYSEIGIDVNEMIKWNKGFRDGTNNATRKPDLHKD